VNQFSGQGQDEGGLSPPELVWAAAAHCPLTRRVVDGQGADANIDLDGEFFRVVENSWLARCSFLPDSPSA